MKFSLSLLCALLVGGIGLCNAIRTTGIQTGALRTRIDIRDFQQDKDLMNMFLIALNMMQTADQNDPKSYYQLSAIHGRPFMTWDNVQAGAGLQDNGYCTHFSNLFCTWHRPYAALFEQVVYDNMQTAINTFQGNDKQRYAAAASRFALPFWDPASVPKPGENVLPDIVTLEKVDVYIPATGNAAGGVRTIPNPLYSYYFHPLDAQGFGGAPPYSVWPRTLRFPTTNNSDATSVDAYARYYLQSQSAFIRSRIYDLFTQYDFSSFGTSIWDPSTQRYYDSIESLHNAIHNLVGGDGHMSDLSVAAFDPVFWLLHSYVDKACAISQALWPNYFIQPAQQRYDTFTTPAGAWQDANSALTPFRSDDNGAFWTSNSVRWPETFGYTYAELRNRDPNALKAYVNQMYGPQASAVRKRQQEASQTTQYVANLHSSKSTPLGSYSVYLSMGDLPSDSMTWPAARNVAGIHSVFSPSKATNRTPDDDAIVAGAIPLKVALDRLVDDRTIPSLNPADVEPYLKKVTWRILTANGVEIKPEQLRDFEVTICKALVDQPRSSTEFPKYASELQPLYDLTCGKPGGACAKGGTSAK